MLGEKVRQRMNELGMSQAQLSRVSGKSTGHIADIVNGKKGQEVSAATLIALSSALKVPVTYFFSGNNSQMGVKREAIYSRKRVGGGPHAEVV